MSITIHYKYPIGTPPARLIPAWLHCISSRAKLHAGQWLVDLGHRAEHQALVQRELLTIAKLPWADSPKYYRTKDPWRSLALGDVPRELASIHPADLLLGFAALCSNGAQQPIPLDFIEKFGTGDPGPWGLEPAQLRAAVHTDFMLLGQRTDFVERSEDGKKEIQHPLFVEDGRMEGAVAAWAFMYAALERDPFAAGLRELYRGEFLTLRAMTGAGGQ